MTLAASSTLCRIFTFLLAGSPIYYSAAPKGLCSSCCQIIERNDIKFMLYTRNNPYKAKYLYMNDERHLLKSNFNFNYPLAIYLHGFSESTISDKQSSQQIKNAFLRMGNYNVLLIDWSPMTTVPWYSNSVENLPIVGRYIAQFIRFLLTQGYQRSKIHLIGFSLGAALAGIVSKQLQQWGILLQRITGLDPALPLFESGSSNRRLQISDARFVDVIHTDGGLLGNPEPMGHADFYPNNGHAIQPGCARQEIANNRWLGILIGCSHQRAWEYFIESIRYPLAFPANRCVTSKVAGKCQYDINGIAFMGMGANKRLRGIFHLNTNDEPPYGRQLPLGQLRRPFVSAAALKDLTQFYNMNNVTTATTAATQIFDTLINVTGIITPPTLTAMSESTTTMATVIVATDALDEDWKLEQFKQKQQQQYETQQQQRQHLKNNLTKLYRTITLSYNNNDNNNDNNNNDNNNDNSINNNNIIGVVVADNIFWNIIQMPSKREILQKT